MEHFRTEEDLMGQYAENERKFVNATKNYLQTISGPLEEIRGRVAQARTEEGQSLADLASVVVSQSEGTANLLQLKADFNDARHKAAKANQKSQQEKIQKLQVLLDEKSKHGSDEDCEALRAQLVTAKMALEDTNALLKECLLTKAELTKKLADASKATSLAQAALEECNKACASMQAQLEECNTACASLAASLEECLKAKEELSAAIDECHKKRDEARAALEECLKAKAELQEQINMLKQGSLLQQDKHAAIINHSRSMDTIVSILRELAERFLELVSQHQEQDAKIKKAVAKMKRILGTEQSMEQTAAAANNAANGASGNSVGSAIQQVESGTEAIFQALEAADETNNAVIQDVEGSD
jgi:chromosome segregation ATPase